MNAKTIKKLFSRETEVSILINADQSVVWNHLIDVDNFLNWNSTLVSLKGKIQPGQNIELVSKLDPGRTFKLKIKEVDAPNKMVWGDRMGSRVYLLSKVDGGTEFTMREKIGGPIFPLFSRMIPSFDEMFNQFAEDLKSVSE